MKRNENIDYPIYRQFFINDAKKLKKKVASSKLLLLKKADRIKYIKMIDLLIKELSEGKIQNSELITNRKAYLKFRNDILMKAYSVFLILGFTIVMILLFVFIFVSF
ncbi:hypothetical protein [Mycoplasma buteonis]|uniref:hypothetical protein n=1 Tax=Mycoplasma buteonis TaxID=171280 RepID=UPI00055E05BA|nr:hypothetical protein [Mycoplasma buteonis]